MFQVSMTLMEIHAQVIRVRKGLLGVLCVVVKDAVALDNVAPLPASQTFQNGWNAGGGSII